MYSTTLRGVFPEPKTVHKKNFIKENMRQIKQMQGLIQCDESKSKPDKYKGIPKVSSQYSTRTTKTQTKPNHNSLESSSFPPTRTQIVPQIKLKPKPIKKKLEIKQLKDFGLLSEAMEKATGCEFIENERITHRGIQTERSDDLSKLYESGVIKYPSPSVIDQINTVRKQAIKKSLDHGDADRVVDKLQNLSTDDKPDFIKQNVISVKQKSHRQENVNPSTLVPPPHYQKGVLPKYLKERKEEMQREVPASVECPDGHVLLPEEERKETLRVLRQTYADRIQELNSMPVRNDTLRMRKRKMELEEELRKIDEGIKVFQRPKVFVKIDV